MKLLLDTQVLLWAAGQPKRLSRAARDLITDLENELMFSAASVWEITIKNSLDRADFQVDPRLFRRSLLDNAYVELPITSQHAVAVSGLPDFHRDPFDRLLIAQALHEGVTLVTSDAQVARYPGPITKV